MLQACHRNQAIRHGIVAIAALDLTSNITHNQIPNSGVDAVDPNHHYHFALQQYKLALQHMQNAVSNGEQNLVSTLITCIVIICFETFHGNHDSAFSQITIGLRIIEQATKKESICQSYEDGISSSMLSCIDADLVRTFVRLDLQVMSFVDGRAANSYVFGKGSGLVDLTSMPAQFRTLKEARHYLNLTMS
jgi:hypothetical protein